MNTQQSNLTSKIDALHNTLNQRYSLDSNWRNAGGWSDDVEGSTLNDGASDEEIAEAESRFGHKFPPSYKEFLSLHRSWEHFWADFTLIGIGSPETQAAQDEIAENVESETTNLQKKLGDLSAPAIQRWEAEEERKLYLGGHLVIGTDFSGAHWVYDTRTRHTDGELTLVHWDISYGAQDPKFNNFYEFLDWAIFEATFRLEQLRAC